MGKAYCGCLNVKINIKGDLSTSVVFPADSLELQEAQENFFQQVKTSQSLFVVTTTVSCFLYAGS